MRSTGGGSGLGGDTKVYHDSIANSKDDKQVLRGILPKNFRSYQAYRVFKSFAWFALGTSIVAFGLTYIRQIGFVTQHPLYRLLIIALLGLSLLLFLLAVLIRMVRLRKPPFDDWVFEIAEKHLSTSVIFYDNKSLYIEYKRGGKEVDKREFVREMSDKSEYFTYFYVKTHIDSGFIQVECTRRQPIPDRATLDVEKDTLWNVVPLGMTLNTNTQKVGPTGWYLNHNNAHKDYVDTMDSVVVLITGGTGCYSKDTLIRMHNTLIR